MKKLFMSVGLVLFALTFIMPQTAAATPKAVTFGPSEWTQYRLNSTQNAVYNNGDNQIQTKERIFHTGDQVRATPVVVGNSLYIGNHETGSLYSFNVLTGKLNWQNQAPNWVHSAMVYYQGQVFVGYGNRNFGAAGVQGTRGTGKSGVLALNAKTGKILWDFATAGEVMPTPAVYNNHLYVVTGDRHLYELNLKTGKQKWGLALGSFVSMSSPNILNGILYCGGAHPYDFFAVDLKNQKLLWKKSFPNVYQGLDDVPPAISQNIVVTTATTKDTKIKGNVNHYIYAMNARTGKLVWKRNLGNGKNVSNNKSGAPMIYNGVIYVGSPITQTFYAIDLKTGKELWTYGSGVMKAPPVAENGIVYFSNKAGDVDALTASTGKLLGTKHLGGILAPAGPIIINHYLIVGSQDDNIYMLPTSAISGANPGTTIDSKPSGRTLPTAALTGKSGIVLYIGIGLIFLIIVVAVERRRRRSS